MGPVSDQALELIRQYGLDNRADRLASLLRPTIVARIRRAELASMPVGASRSAGEPDLPPGTDWPTNAGRPLVHVAQIHLPDVAPFDVDGLLPSEGWLCFWVLCGDPREDKEKEPIQKVLYIEQHADLRRTSPPSAVPDELCLHPCVPEFGTYYSLPDAWSDSIRELDLNDEEHDAYGDLSFEMREVPLRPLPELPKSPWWRRRPRFGFHQLLGYPERADVPAEYQGCVLLLQVRSDDDGLGALWTWGDGSLNYFLGRDDLNERRFEATEMLMDYGD